MERTLADLERQLDALEAELHADALEAELHADVPAPAAADDDGYRILMEVLADIHALSALERALVESPRVRTLELQAYAGGWASLVVDVS